ESIMCSVWKPRSSRTACNPAGFYNDAFSFLGKFFWCTEINGRVDVVMSLLSLANVNFRPLSRRSISG
ncbi:hypothetical protein SK128_013764, partial [Halocaridina rubra]